LLESLLMLLFHLTTTILLRGVFTAQLQCYCYDTFHRCSALVIVW